MVELEKNRHSVGQSTYHLVFRPKYKVRVFSNLWVRKYCADSFRRTAQAYNMTIYEMQVMSDHVHIFVGIPSTMSVSQALQLLKGRSAREFFQKFKVWKAYFAEGHKIPHLWSPGKFYRSVGNVTAEVIERYIKYSQKEWNFDYTDKPAFKQTTLTA